MPIKTNLDTTGLQSSKDNIRKAIILQLQSLGMRCVAEARRKGSYKDQTGNLRSSIGYVIADKGNIIGSSDFGVVKKGLQGSTDGCSFAQQIAASYPSDLVLIVVAGMNYAVHVQHKGYDVLASAETLARDLVRKMKL